ncbi:MAG: DNA-3-methyladenine glycosylase I [Phycisphaerales bacterium]|jgi:DNA-3-methyladenine glycosylase I|nr:DNA-3-methyladenine glycosylase I [Phycisphaerales bacterium]
MAKPPASESVVCPWAASEPERSYHDAEWGVASFDDAHLFEMLCLEGAQAGLSWRTILVKREAYRKAFFGWDIERCARISTSHVERLLHVPDGPDAIVRHRGKIESVRDNARAARDVIAREGSLSAYLWGLAGGAPVQNAWENIKQVPARTETSEAMSKALTKAGFRFVGSTTCYAFMQAVGMLNDHLVSCPRHAACAKLAKERGR